MAEAGEEQKGPTFTKSHRIRQLNEIDQDIANLLRAAGTAVKALTTISPSPASPSPTTPPPPSSAAATAQHSAVLTPSREYLALLDSIRTRIRRQILALEEAGILHAEPADRSNEWVTASTTKYLAGQSATQANRATAAQTTGGGLGRLDVGWLNGRNDRMERLKEAEVWAAARAFLEREELKAEGKADMGGEVEVKAEEKTKAELGDTPMELG
ncbi:MAG: hypothetical protein M1824_000378 [Vezdaea acicularis]|nr:MAG: hypothetical protein M1824_000378 [Vezdaea acicularis]